MLINACDAGRRAQLQRVDSAKTDYNYGSLIWHCLATLGMFYERHLIGKVIGPGMPPGNPL